MLPEDRNKQRPEMPQSVCLRKYYYIFYAGWQSSIEYSRLQQKFRSQVCWQIFLRNRQAKELSHFPVDRIWSLTRAPGPPWTPWVPQLRIDPLAWTCKRPPDQLGLSKSPALSHKSSEDPSNVDNDPLGIGTPREHIIWIYSTWTIIK